MLVPLLAVTAHTFSASDLSTFWAPWFKSPYSYMMTSDPGWPDAPAVSSAGPLFGAGTDGFYRYGGMRDCLQSHHGEGAREETAYAWLEGMAGVPLHIGHIGDGYQRGFQAYNPAMFDWLAVNLIPSPQQPYRGATFQDAYNQTFFRAVRLFALSYRELTTKLELASEAAAYKAAMVGEPEFDGLNWLDARYGGRLRDASSYPLSGGGTMLTAPMAMGFWLRRHLDGSAGVLSGHLDALLRAYDPEFCKRVELGPGRCLL